MKKILLITAASTLSLTLSTGLFAGNIEKAQRYSAPLESPQNVVDSNVNAMAMGQEEIAMKKRLRLGSLPEVQELGMYSILPVARGQPGSNPEVQEPSNQYK